MRTCLMEIDLLIRFYTMEKLERKSLRFHLIFSFVLTFLGHLLSVKNEGHCMGELYTIQGSSRINSRYAADAA